MSSTNTTSRRRNRTAFSCENCRRRRQRCDRQTPCTSCIRTNRQSTCHYLSSTASVLGSEISFTPTAENRPLALSPAAEQDLPPLSTLQSFGYSGVNSFNSIGIFRRLEEANGSRILADRQIDQIIKLPPEVSKAYVRFLRRLPARLYLQPLWDLYQREVQWHYSFIDEIIFADQLTQFYENSYTPDKDNSIKIRAGLFYFPSLLFQVVALAMQFMPPVYAKALDDLRIGNSFENLAKDFSADGREFLNLFSETNHDLVFIQAELLRVYWLKNQGRVVESWQCLGQLVLEAQEIGLYQQHNDVDSFDGGDSCTYQWDKVQKQRLMINLYLWDSEMGMVLGKPLSLRDLECVIVPPADCVTPHDWRRIFPYSRRDSEKPSMFSFRLVEYRLQKKLPEVRVLEAGGPSPKDFATIRRLHAEVLEYIDTLPPLYRFDNPDTTYDNECPWLVPQRYYLQSITWFFVLALHKPYIFFSSRSRDEAIKAAVYLLHAQKHHFECVKAHHYRLFTLAYMTLEAAAVVLAIFMTFPSEISQHSAETLSVINDGLRRLRRMQSVNAMAGTAADIIQSILRRSEIDKSLNTTGPMTLSSVSDTSPNFPESSSVEPFMTSDVLHSGVLLSSENPRRPSANIDSNIMNIGTETGPGYLGDSTLSLNPWTTGFLQPTANLLYHGYTPDDLFSAFSSQPECDISHEHRSAGNTVDNDQSQSAFTCGSFWDPPM